MCLAEVDYATNSKNWSRVVRRDGPQSTTAFDASDRVFLGRQADAGFRIFSGLELLGGLMPSGGLPARFVDRSTVHPQENAEWRRRRPLVWPPPSPHQSA